MPLRPFHGRNGLVAFVGGADRTTLADGIPNRGAAELEANGQAGAVVESVRSTERRARFNGAFSTPPQISPNATALVHRGRAARRLRRAPKGRSSKLEHSGDAANYRFVERPGFSHGPAFGDDSPTTAKVRWGWPGCSCCQCPGHLVVASVPTRSQILAPPSSSHYIHDHAVASVCGPSSRHLPPPAGFHRTLSAYPRRLPPPAWSKAGCMR